MSETKSDARGVSALLWLLDQGIWCDRAKTFRDLFDRLIAHALAQATKHGNFNTLTRIVNGVPDIAQRRQIIRRIISAYPAVTYNLIKERFEKNKRPALKNDCATTVQPSVFAPGNFSVSETETVLHRASYTKNEIMELLLDVLTQYRNEFTEKDVMVLEDIITKIKSRARKKAGLVNADQPVQP